MDGEVHCSEHVAHRVGLRDAVLGVDEDGHVMIPVEEGERALAQDDEGGVAQLHEFGEREYVAPDGDARDGVRVAVAHRVVHAVVEQRRHKVGQHGGRAEDAENGQPDIPQYQRLPQVVRISLLHPPTPQVHERQVQRRGVQGYGPTLRGEADDALHVRVVLHILQSRNRQQSRHLAFLPRLMPLLRTHPY